MLTVTIDINGRFIGKVHAVRVRPKDRKMCPHTRCTYDIYRDGETLIGRIREHRYGDGAFKLANKMLRFCKKEMAVEKL